MPSPATLRQAWGRALHGPDGFYRTGQGPGEAFATPSTAAPGVLAAAVAALSYTVEAALGHPPGFTVLDLGAGRGDLLAALARVAPPWWRLMGVDVRARPPALPDRVSWQPRLPDRVLGTVVAVEWLDTIPCEVIRNGAVALARPVAALRPPAAADQAWLQQWWPGWWRGQAEVGRARDQAWQRVLARLEAGVAVAIDYGHLRESRRSTLTGWRAGRPVDADWAGGTDITAHVAVDSLDAELLGGREALRRLLSPVATPVGALERLQWSGEAGVLAAAGGFGEYWWAGAARHCGGCWPPAP